MFRALAVMAFPDPEKAVFDKQAVRCRFYHDVKTEGRKMRIFNFRFGILDFGLRGGEKRDWGLSGGGQDMGGA
jgi:hypothetical protein